MTPHVVKAMPAVIFKHHIHCDHPGIKGVVVDYSELGEENYYPFVHGEAYVDLYMDDYRIVLVDAKGGRYMSTIPYTTGRLMDVGKYIKICYEQGRDNKMLVLNRSERALKYQMMDDVSIETYKCVLKLQDVSRHYWRSIFFSWIFICLGIPNAVTSLSILFKEDCLIKLMRPSGSMAMREFRISGLCVFAQG